MNNYKTKPTYLKDITFQADIIYHLFDRFTEYQEELIRKKREEFKYTAVFPCKLRVMPDKVFVKRSGLIMSGVIVEAGVVKTGTPICVPSKDFIDVGVVTSLQFNNKEVETARKGEEVCVKIDSVPGEAPKMFGRHFDEKVGVPNFTHFFRVFAPLFLSGFLKM